MQRRTAATRFTNDRRPGVFAGSAASTCGRSVRNSPGTEAVIEREVTVRAAPGAKLTGPGSGRRGRLVRGDREALEGALDGGRQQVVHVRKWR
jgi:hypothetical protein